MAISHRVLQENGNSFTIDALLNLQVQFFILSTLFQRWTSSISRIFVRLLAMKSNEPSLWIMAAKWEFEENGSATNGRGLLLRALRHHPESIQIYTEVVFTFIPIHCLY